MANQCGREPRWQRHLSFLTAGVYSPREKLPNFRTQCRLGRVFSALFSVALFHSDGAEAKCGKEVGQQRYFETVGAIVAPPESTRSGSGQTNIGEDTAPRNHFGSIGIPFSPANLPVQGGKKRR